jgi:hypothetical protein
VGFFQAIFGRHNPVSSQSSLTSILRPGVPYEIAPFRPSGLGGETWKLTLRPPGAPSRTVLATRSPHGKDWYFSQRYADPHGIHNFSRAGADHVHFKSKGWSKDPSLNGRAIFRNDSVDTAGLLGLRGGRMGGPRSGLSPAALSRQADTVAARGLANLKLAGHARGQLQGSQNITMFGRVAGDLRATATTAAQINALARTGTSWANGMTLKGIGWKAESAGRFARNAFAASETLSRQGMKLGESAAKLSLLIPEANLKAATALAEAQAKAALRAQELAAKGVSKISESAVKAAFKQAEMLAKAAAQTVEAATKTATLAAEVTTKAGVLAAEASAKAVIYSAAAVAAGVAGD